MSSTIFIWFPLIKAAKQRDKNVRPATSLKAISRYYRQLNGYDDYAKYFSCPNSREVSWVRRKGGEPQLITFGLHTYSSDSRYSLNYQLPNDWKLQIKFANKRDEGHYECQVSSHPPRIFHVFLIVVVPKVEIVDERGIPIVDKFYKESSTIELKCVISHVSHSSSYVTWKHGQRILNYDTSRGGISVKTDILADGAMSRLFIAYAKKYDSGNYTCALGDVASNTVYIYVLH
ncbi:hypothetical protein J437_LFUL013097, partial [Ladona fulva]